MCGLILGLERIGKLFQAGLKTAKAVISKMSKKKTKQVSK